MVSRSWRSHTLRTPNGEIVWPCFLSSLATRTCPNAGFSIAGSTRFFSIGSFLLISANYLISVTSARVVPTLISSPLAFPMSALARGEMWDSVPCEGSASSIPTMRNVWLLPLSLAAPPNNGGLFPCERFHLHRSLPSQPCALLPSGQSFLLCAPTPRL